MSDVLESLLSLQRATLMHDLEINLDRHGVWINGDLVEPDRAALIIQASIDAEARDAHEDH